MFVAGYGSGRRWGAALGLSRFGHELDKGAGRCGVEVRASHPSKSAKGGASISEEGSESLEGKGGPAPASWRRKGNLESVQV